MPVSCHVADRDAAPDDGGGVGELHDNDLEAAQVRSELRGGHRVIELTVLVMLAITARAGATSQTPRAVAELHDLDVRYERLPPEVPAMLIAGIILVKRKLDARREALAIWHELAHHLLRTSLHTHGDVWALTLLLAAPPWILQGLREAHRLDADQLAWDATIPRWAAVERLVLAEESAA